MGIFELLLLAVGLAMDAFAVSVCMGLASKKAGLKECLTCGIWFGVFQGGMPLIGYFAGSWFEQWIGFVAPWVVLIILSLIGINMIREAFSEEEETQADFGFKNMFAMAVATSIDALAVGITFVANPVTLFPATRLVNTLFAGLVICVVTLVISAFGVKIGNVFGMRYKAGAEVMGGTILIFIGLRSLLTSLDTAGAMSDPDTLFGMLIPFAGTVAGAAFVYAKKRLSGKLRCLLGGLSAGIMFSISVWGLIEPAMGGFEQLKGVAALLVLICLVAGIGVQILIDHMVPHTHVFGSLTEGPQSTLKQETRVMLAEVIHHVPEGIALGSIYAAHFMETEWVPAAAAFALAAAIAIQNFPEALFVSMPIRQTGSSTGKSFFMGVVSGIPVPLLGVITLIVVVLFPGILPYVMAGAGGAMIFNTVEELPQVASEDGNDTAALAFAAGFVLVMAMIFIRF